MFVQAANELVRLEALNLHDSWLDWNDQHSCANYQHDHRQV